MFSAMEVLASGLSAARLRVNVVASNIANAETTQTEDGGPYKAKSIVQVARTAPSSFSNALDRMTLAKPQVMSVVEDQAAPRNVYQPGHPDANEDGFVAYPNINVVNTMTNMMSATRLYQANVSAIKAVRDMGQSARQISLRF